MSKQLPEMFNEFGEARRVGFVEVKYLKDAGKKIVGTYCTFTPWELIYAAGAIPVSLCGTSEEPIGEAEKDLPRNLCPLIKSSYGFGKMDTCPYFYFADLLVGETTCDGKKKMYEYLSEFKAMHVMQLPQTTQGADAHQLWRNEMVLLKERLEKELGVEITEDMIRNAIKQRNEERKLYKEFYELSAMCPPPITGLEQLKVMYGAGFKMDREEQKQSMRALIDEIKDRYEQGERKVSPDQPRILITGCPMGGATEKVAELIEENGGVVVGFENCTGLKSYEDLVNESGDVYDALTEKYLNIPCSVMSPNTARLELLSRLIDEYKVDGVIDVVLQACHTYNVETLQLKRFINGEKKVPYMSIETDYSQSDTGQLRTRLSAFIEML